ncbi:MAG TPA: hypothetical protein VHP31_12250 [Caproicibacter sp.]|nr:hypothetical protein [Caproicibacter sp.]
MYEDHFPTLPSGKLSIAQLTLYSWSFDFYAIRDLINYTKRNIEQLAKERLNQANENIENCIVFQNAMVEVEAVHRMEPYAYRSFIVTLYSIVEACLDSYCNMCQIEFGLKVGLSDFADKGITRSINYLVKVVQIGDITSDNRWNKMKIVNKIRNDIVHRGGCVSDNKKLDLYRETFGIDTNGEDSYLYVMYENVIEIYKACKEFVEFVLSKESPLPQVKNET